MIEQTDTQRTKDAAGFAVERMTLHDVPEVMAIERESFPMPWPEPAYRHELTNNPKAYFIVARSAQPKPALTIIAAPKRNWLNRLLARTRQSPTLRQAQDAVSNLLISNPSTSSGRSLQSLPVVGYAGMWNMVDEMHIATIASHPQMRGKGIGELLLIHLLRECQRQNALNATLEVRVGNIVAQQLYKKYGFEEVGYRKAYYHDNREDAFMLTVTTFQTAAYAAKLDALEAIFKDAHYETIS